MAFVSVVPLTAGAAVGSASVCEQRGSLSGARVGAARSVRPAVAARRSTQPRMQLGLPLSESLRRAGNFKTLMKFVDLAGIDLDSRPGTLFAPDDRAFASLKPGTVEAWLKKPDIAKAIILHHFVPDKVMTLAKIKGCGFWDNVSGGPLSYEGLGPIVKVGGSRLINESSNRECDNAIYHVVEGIILPLGVKAASAAAGYIPSVPRFSESTVTSIYPTKPMQSRRTFEAASLPATVGGRKAMGLMKDLPFWAYGPPYNCAPQEDYEPISVATPSLGIGVDYQLMPPGSVIVEPDSVDANKLNPISGMSKYIGKTKKQVEGKAISDYSRLDQASNTW